MATLRLRQDAVWREVGDEILAVDAELRSYASTNSSGALLWKRLADGATRDELADALVTAFAIDWDAALADVDAFVAELRENGYLEPDPSAVEHRRA